ncbi:unnamed protein product [Caenorhabditis auriculariae]|uniref:Tc3 transposase DNA binding domain-containing protein n=1 Tax=Caenorhabditis auriculariae TaxID=2777116 RepID=A0A8S1HXB8_9PELO|nr:unnamed protein product [Caenorhabditis auriculariae]
MEDLRWSQQYANSLETKDEFSQGTLKLQLSFSDGFTPARRCKAIVVGRQNGLTMMTLAGMFGVTEACISQFLKRQKAQDGTGRANALKRPRVIDRNDSPPCDQTGSFLEFAISAIRLDRETTMLLESWEDVQVKWAKEHLNWTRQDWNKIPWSDESKFLLFGSDGIQ